MAKEHVHGVFQSIASGYDAANDRISFGMHRLWKRALVERAVSCCDGSRIGYVLDVACGTGDITCAIAKESPRIFTVGLDFSSEMLQVADERTAGMENVMLVQGDAMNLPFDDRTFDAAVISFGLRNMPDYERVLSEMARVVRPGGMVACLDASVPDDALIQPFYQFYYKNIMTFLGGGFNHRDEYEWLYSSTQEFLRKAELKSLFEQVGLTHVQVNSYMCGAAAMHAGMVPLFGEPMTSAIAHAAQTIADDMRREREA